MFEVKEVNQIETVIGECTESEICTEYTNELVKVLKETHKDSFF